MQENKKALIVEGGGSRGVFSFGVIDTFIKAAYNPFDIHLGVSNGAVVQLWYLLKVADYNLDKMLFSASKNYVRYSNILFNKSIMDFEKLYQDANKVFPINFDRLQNHLDGKSFFVVVSDAVAVVDVVVFVVVAVVAVVVVSVVVVGCLLLMLLLLLLLLMLLLMLLLVVLLLLMLLLLFWDCCYGCCCCCCCCCCCYCCWWW